MNEFIRMNELPDFDIAEYLDSPETIAAFLAEIIREDDAALLASAFGDIARAIGMKLE
jgi:probable addiction module antidote protein